MKLILLLCAAASLVVADNERCPAGQGVKWGQGCIPCEPGRYRPANHESNYCQSCPSGYTNGVTGATDESSCAKCDKGYWRDADSGECVECPIGTYSDTADAASCTSCPEGTTTRDPRSRSASECVDVSCSPGYGYDWYDDECHICGFGHYSDDGQTPGCKLCPTGSAPKEDGATSIEQCSEECWVGYERQGDRCVECPVGTYRWRNEDQCQPCPAGSYTEITGRHRCECLPGHRRINSADISTPCTPCAVGMYLYYGRFCTPCLGGATTDGEGKDSIYDCKCEKGYTRDADSGHCVKCPKGTFSDTFGDASCTSCPEGTTTTVEGVDDASSCFDASCAPGEGYSSYSGGCEKCSGPTYSPDGKTPGCLDCPRGYKPKKNGATSVDQCTECSSVGWERQGDRCVECPIGTFRGYFTSGNTCQPCPEGSTTNTVGSRTCICERGNWSFVSGTCKICPIGQYFSHVDCYPCEPGTTTTEEGQTSCVPE